MAITRINEFQAAEGKAAELFNFFKALVPFITSSAGNLSCQVLQSTTDEKQIVVIETWLDEASHQQSLANYPPEQMQAAMSLIGAAPKGHYYQC